MPEESKADQSAVMRRSIRVFVSSTFSDMVEDRNELMTQAWPELRSFCRERQVELVEVDLRWGIAEEQSTRKETLKLCLDEIRACRPFFIGLLGERYGWTPGAEAFTADLQEEQPWLRRLAGKSVTELEILHGVLNNPEMAGRSFFYFRDPAYSRAHGADFLPENAEAAVKQAALKETIRQVCKAGSQPTATGLKGLLAGLTKKKPNLKPIPLRENYADPRALAKLVLGDLKVAIEAQFHIEENPDPLTCEARDHEAFAETRRRTYIGRPDYFNRLDRHAAANGGPLVLVGDSGSGKSALMANWLEHWRTQHPQDFIFQHYIGGTPDSADHWRLIARLIEEIRRWSNDPDNPPRTHDDMLREFPLWLAKARSNAEHKGVRCILLLDALNQLEDNDHARQLGWLPQQPFADGLRLVVSTLPSEAMDAVKQRDWETLSVEPLTPGERRRMVEHYLERFGKKLDALRLDRLAAAQPAANPLYLKILLDELRVTGTHDRLDERLTDYLASPDIPALLNRVLARYQHDYERDRAGLVSKSLGLIWAARRGLSETELLRALKPVNQDRLPVATWSPLRAALEEGLVHRGGILNFAHDFLRSAVEAAFAPTQARRDELRLRLAGEFEQQPITARSCDELPWLLQQTGQNDRLRACLLDIDRFLEIRKRDPEELRRYWVDLGEERKMGSLYLASFESWSKRPELENILISSAANQLALFLNDAALFSAAEPLFRRALNIDEKDYGPDHFVVARDLNNLAKLLAETDRLNEAEPLYRRTIAIWEKNFGAEDFRVVSALGSLGQLLKMMGRLAEAEPLMRRALANDEKIYGPDHPTVASNLNNLAILLQVSNRVAEAEPLMRRALAIYERSYGLHHPDVAGGLNILATLLQITNRHAKAEPLMRRALAIDERSYGLEHPMVASRLKDLAQLMHATNRLAEAEPLMHRALAINEANYGPFHSEVARDLNNLGRLLCDTNRMAEAEPLIRRAVNINEQHYGANHPEVAISLGNLAQLLRITNRSVEAEPIMRRVLEIDERSLGPDHPDVAIDLNNLAGLLCRSKRIAEAEPLVKRHLEIFLKFTRATGHQHPHLREAFNTYAGMLDALGKSESEIAAALMTIAPEAQEYFK
jgi:nephrocystin-3